MFSIDNWIWLESIGSIHDTRKSCSYYQNFDHLFDIFEIKKCQKSKLSRYIIPRVYFRFEAGSSNSGKLVSNISSTQINPSFTYDILILTNYQTGRDTMNSQELEGRFVGSTTATEKPSGWLWMTRWLPIDQEPWSLGNGV